MTFQQIEIDKVVETLEVSSVHLVNLGPRNIPVGMASGLLIDYNGVRHLCTAAHAIRDNPLHLQIKWDAKQRVTITRLLDLTPICSIRLGLDSDFEYSELDFAFCRLPFDDVPMHEVLNQDGSGAVLRSRPCTLFCQTDIQEPRTDRGYGFAGQTILRPEKHPLMIISTMTRVVYPLGYVGEHNGLYAFQFAGEHPGQEYFQGCSGAPIIDLDGNVVAIVCKGCPKKASIIFGFPINRFKAVLDVSSSGVLDSALSMLVNPHE